MTALWTHLLGSTNKRTHICTHTHTFPPLKGISLLLRLHDAALKCVSDDWRASQSCLIANKPRYKPALTNATDPAAQTFSGRGLRRIATRCLSSVNTVHPQVKPHMSTPNSCKTVKCHPKSNRKAASLPANPADVNKSTRHDRSAPQSRK